jgi:hypothetical protein
LTKREEWQSDLVRRRQAERHLDIISNSTSGIDICCGKCENLIPLIHTYRCFFCERWFCESCAVQHFGQSREEWFDQFEESN